MRILKKHIAFFLLIIIHCSSWSQKPASTDSPCTDAIVQKAQGRWMKHPSFDRGSFTSAEANKRIDEIQTMVLKIYPQPVGVDAVWHRSCGLSYFGAKRKYYRNQYDVLTFDDSNLPHFSKYYYRCGFYAYNCAEGNFMNQGFPGETNTQIMISANSIDGIVNDLESDDSWTINGLPVKMKKPVIKLVNGFELQHSEPGSNSRFLLVHRKDMLPFTPVTRKQYLDQCIEYLSKLHNEIIKMQEQMPVRTPEEQEKEKKARLEKFQKEFGNDPKRLKSAVDYYLSGYQTDQQQSEERVKNAKKNKEDELRKFEDELEKTTKEGLLDSPAFVLVKYHSTPVFETDPLKGNMLVTENPDYIRKDLPKHVPQLLVLWWTWNDWAPQSEVAKIIEEQFPFDKLHAMIDK